MAKRLQKENKGNLREKSVPYKRASVYFKKKTLDKFEKAKRKLNRSRSSIIELALEEYFAKYKI